MSVHCPDCGAVASSGWPIKHREGCPLAKLDSKDLRDDLSEELWKLLPGQRMAAYEELADAVLTFVRTALAEREDGELAEAKAEHELAAMREVIRAAVAWRTAEVHYFKGVLDDNDAQAKAQRETRWCEKKHELRKRLDAFVQDYGRVNRD